ncbi:hypothetical protein V6N11_043203 [Hibiscus sabdariffa]|uniref:Uncharacterized protein n=1 Tax=Hibiscus sabdariffa TaxID=183260 RepID=A0ABR2QYU6_9ROSI
MVAIVVHLGEKNEEPEKLVCKELSFSVVNQLHQKTPRSWKSGSRAGHEILTIGSCRRLRVGVFIGPHGVVVDVVASGLVTVY